MKIENKELGEFFDTENIHYLDKVTYIPSHVKGNASHTDAEQGVIISWNDTNVMVLYCRSRTVQATTPEDLVWG